MIAKQKRLSAYYSFTLGLFILAAFTVNNTSAAEGGVVLIYHHVSDSTPSITSVSPDQFEQHLDYLEENDFAVLGLSELLDSVSNNTALPERAIAISFDDAYESVYQVAFPLLKQRNWPFSVFVASESIDKGYDGFMTWDQIRDVRDYGAEVGGHSVSHAHLIRQRETESDSAWLSRVTEEIDQGNQRIEQEIGESVRLFAYPYGEFNTALKRLLETRGIYGLAQQSGAIGGLTDMQAIPRYPMAQSFAAMERFALVTNSKALPVTDVDSGDMVRIAGQRHGQQGIMSIQLQEGDHQLNNLACYSSSGEKLDITSDGYFIDIPLPQFSPGRNKVNCTSPSSSETGVYYWFSQQWVVKTPEGLWPNE